MCKLRAAPARPLLPLLVSRVRRGSWHGTCVWQTGRVGVKNTILDYWGRVEVTSDLAPSDNSMPGLGAHARRFE